MQQIDFIEAYAQAPIKSDHVYGNPTWHQDKEWALQGLHPETPCKSLQAKQAGCIWNQYMTDKLWEIGFQQSQIDECVFYCDDIIFIVYVDDGLFFGNYDNTLTLIIRQLKKAGLNIEDQGQHQENS